MGNSLQCPNNLGIRVIQSIGKMKALGSPAGYANVCTSKFSVTDGIGSETPVPFLKPRH